MIAPPVNVKRGNVVVLSASVASLNVALGKF
jgi:hypothetical protein